MANLLPVFYMVHVQFHLPSPGTSASSSGNETWIGAGESVAFSSPNFPSSYGSDAKDWVFCADDPDGRLEIDCTEFEVGWKFFFCFSDLLLVSADSSLEFMYCGADGPQSVITTGRGTAVCLIPSGANNFKGFNCTATALPPSPDAQTTTAAN
ncbi:uncharacterized protein [Penaeus vannamei]|uniref:uncharacterized protein isoform X2 n=1 Tax=Penaeus vannamei TaxID=6689 RepID=UPI000F68D24E|nr:uncharacterized protein LOC113826390 isoform X2 [Penaeus vannamei]